MIPNPVNEESLTEPHLNSKLKELQDEMLQSLLERILALKLSYAASSSATSPKLWSEEETAWRLSKEK
jgi:hypothetical protein